MTAYQGFNPNLFAVAAHAVSGDKEDLPTVLVIQPTARYGTGNVLVALQGLETPIVLTVVLGQAQTDARKEFKLRLAGPRAAPEYAPPAPAPVDRALIDVLNGLPPQPDARPVDLAGVEPEARAWRVGAYTSTCAPWPRFTARPTKIARAVRAGCTPTSCAPSPSS